MNLTNAEILQYITWSLTLIEFILALYILLLNYRHRANQHVAALLLLFAVNNLGVGLLTGATNVTQARLPTVLLAATSPGMQPALLLIAVVLLKPEWLRGRWRWFWWLIYGLAFLPALLTFIDSTMGIGLWYTGLDQTAYAGGHVQREAYTAGFLSLPLRVLNIYVMGLSPLIPILYVLWRDKAASQTTRQLAWVLLTTLLITLVVQFGLRNLLGAELATFIVGATLASGYAYAGFQQMISEHRTQTGRLQNRLTALVLVIAVPILLGVVLLVASKITDTVEQNAREQLRATSRALASNISTWLELDIQTLQQLVALPAITSMDADQQKPLLETIADTSPHIYLASTTDLDGVNVARSDDEAPKDYSDLAWFRGARDTATVTFQTVTFQTLVGRASDEPALVVAMPIRDSDGRIVGVGMFASDLTDITAEVAVSRVGESGYAYVLDAMNRVVAHPDPSYTTELRDLSAYPLVAALRAGEDDRVVVFVDEAGQTWWAHVRKLDNGWHVIVQQSEDELSQTPRELATLIGLMGIGGALVLLVMFWLTIRQALRPISDLTATATAIAAGDLSRSAPVESEDELGTLARTFNAMTEQLRDLIGSLEQQVQDRTAQLARHSSYLEATADVERAVTAILDPDKMMRQTVDLIRERFGLYYVGLFLVDPTGEWAVLRAGTGEAGQAMLDRGHRIRVGEGMIGWSVVHGESRVTAEVGEDAVRLATDALPETRSEAALPLRSRGQVIGALTVQHTEPGSFTPDILAVLQTMADQVAVALDNVQLFARSQAALEALRQAYGEVSGEAWVELLRTREGQGYRYAEQAVTTVSEEWQPEMRRAQQTGQIVQSGEGATLAVPIKLRDQMIAVMRLRKPGETDKWPSEEIALVEALAEQLSLALDSARLHEDTQRRAAREQAVGEITARVRETLDVETVLRTAAGEMRRALDLEELVVRLTAPEARVGDQAVGIGRIDEST